MHILYSSWYKYEYNIYIYLLLLYRIALLSPFLHMFNEFKLTLRGFYWISIEPKGAKQ
jgi:hypothetical protein